MAVELIQDLENCLNKPLEATLLWNFPTIESLAQYLAEGSEQSQEIERANDQSLQKDELDNVKWVEGEI